MLSVVKDFCLSCCIFLDEMDITALPTVEQQQQPGNQSQQSQNDAHALKAQAEERLQTNQDQIDRQ
jgi:hypothetical protein